MPVFGIEYKDRKSDQRFGITPSLTAGTRRDRSSASRSAASWPTTG
jgi:hypothetical protein